MPLFGLTTEKGAQKRMDESLDNYRNNVEKTLREFGITDDAAIQSFLNRADESAGMKRAAGDPNPMGASGADAKGAQGAGTPGNGSPAPNADGGQAGTGENKEAGGSGQAGGAENPNNQPNPAQGGQQAAPQGQPADASQQLQGTPAPQGQPQPGQPQTGQPNPTNDVNEDTQKTIAALSGRLEADEKVIGQIMPILQKMGIKVDQGGPQIGAAPENGGNEHDEYRPGTDESKLNKVRGILGHDK